MITDLLDQLALAQETFVDALSTLDFRAKGINPGTRRKDTDPEITWYAMAPFVPHPMPTDVHGAHPPAAVIGRGLGHLMHLSAHQQMAQQAFVQRVEPHVIAARDLLALAVPVFSLSTGFLHLAVSIDHTGTLGTPLWRVAGHGLHGLSPSGPTRKAMADLLHDLAQEPTPTGVYRIGNKTYGAATPESAVAQHIRLLAPKTPKHRRKAPAHLPEIKRVWSTKEATDMARSLTATWAKP